MAYTKINNTRTYYEAHGNGEPILFIHGLGSSVADWKIQIDFFEREFKVIAYDIRGHGLSETSNSAFGIANLADDCAGLLRSLSSVPAHLVGISLGGMIAYQLAVSDPDLVKTLTVVNSIPEFNISTIRLRIKFWMRLLIVRLFGLRTIGILLSKKLFPGENFEALRKEFVIKWSKNDTRAYLNTLRAMKGWSVKNQLGSIKCPTLIIASEFDYTPLEMKHFYAKMISNVKLVMIKNTRHALPVEKPEKFNHELQSFLVNYK
jgi:pimeloyl-ACP methyl ester carboxylesterase